MALIEKLVGKIVTKGRLTLVWPDGASNDFGPGGEPELTVRLASEAELWWQRAMANDANRQPSYYPGPGYIPDAIAARDC